MKTTLVAVLGLMLVLSLISGCGPSFGRTADERAHMYSSVTRSELRMAKDDIDNLLLMESRSRLTRWH